VALAKILRGDGFHSHQQPLATAPLREFQQLRIIGQQHGRQTIPLEFQWNQRGEKQDRIIAVGYDIEVNEDKLSRAALPNVGDDFLDRLLVRPSPPCWWHDAEITIVDAASRRFKNVVREITVTRQE
jgi:hypothetical protein